MTNTENYISEFRNLLEEVAHNKVKSEKEFNGFVDALLVNIDKIQTSYENEIKVIETSETLEETGYSYSGISDILRNQPERKNELLFAIDKQYCELRHAHKVAVDKSNRIESHLRSVVSCFLHFHRVLLQDKVIDENKLTYSKVDENVIINIEGENTIKYAYYKRADV